MLSYLYAKSKENPCMGTDVSTPLPKDDCNNPKLDLININVQVKLGQTLSICS